MKKVSKFLLREEVEVLNDEEMKLLLGGAYRCCCNWSDHCFGVDHIEDGGSHPLIRYVCGPNSGSCFIV